MYARVSVVGEEMKCECGREYKKDGVWLKRHQAVCKVYQETPKGQLTEAIRRNFWSRLVTDLYASSPLMQRLIDNARGIRHA